MKIFACVGDQLLPLQISTLTAVGGAQGTGLRIANLRSKTDYAILSLEKDQLVIHPLTGIVKTQVTLKAGQVLAIQDLQILAVAESAMHAQTPAPPVHAVATSLCALLGRFSEREDLGSALTELIRILLSHFHFERGLVIQKGVSDKFEVTCEIGVQGSQPWLSESLIQTVLRSQTPVFIGNIIASEYAANRSLLATGFTSVFCWPLVVRGQILGALVGGSSLPHSGLSESEQRDAVLITQVAGLFLSFYLRDQKLKEEVQLLRQQLKHDDLPLTTLNGELIKTLDLAATVANTPLSVLIQGETGTGKEVLARWLHENSDRKHKPFVAINSGAIPAELLESLLFGHRKGSFTGAMTDQMGKFLAAQGGTIFLDEVGDLPESLQVKLLRVLQERVVEPLGSNKSVSIDVRILAASHKPIAALVHEGKFRSDLYYRLAEVMLEIPPLRNRPDDIGLLALEFLKEFTEKTLSEDAWSWIKDQAWLGNTRELKSTIKRGALLARGNQVTLNDLRTGAPILNLNQNERNMSS
ncbi:MAG: sigma 54-interacting transcriptional regulator, partial [Bdellovibrionales bacterium]